MSRSSAPRPPRRAGVREQQGVSARRLEVVGLYGQLQQQRFDEDYAPCALAGGPRGRRRRAARRRSPRRSRHRRRPRRSRRWTPRLARRDQDPVLPGEHRPQLGELGTRGRVGTDAVQELLQPTAGNRGRRRDGGDGPAAPLDNDGLAGPLDCVVQIPEMAGGFRSPTASSRAHATSTVKTRLVAPRSRFTRVAAGRPLGAIPRCRGRR